jgi:hypothetical protein
VSCEALVFRLVRSFFVEIQKLVGRISPETLLVVFHDWISWCERLIASDGNYFE